jgi:nitroreductase
MNLKDLIERRRNVKPSFFTGEVIPDSDVLAILNTANWAPTHGYTEPWRFVVFSGNALEDFANFQSKLYESLTPSERFEERKFTKLKETPLLASHIIAIAVSPVEKSKIPLIEEIVATSCAVQNMLLTAAAKSIAVHWTSGGMTYTEEMKSFLGCKTKDLILGFLYLGKAPDKINKEGKRVSLISEKITWNK